MNSLNKLYKSKLSLLTDLYQLTMGYGYWKQGIYDRPAVFHLYFRKNPFGGNYAIASGLQLVIEYLQGLKFERDDIQYLGQLKGADGKNLFDESYLNYLQRFQFKCDIHAVPEGTIVFPNEPIIRVEGPLLQAQLIETALLNIVNFSTLITTKASRVVQAAGKDEVLEFGLRRAHGIDGGVMASRAAYIGGCAATSNVLAGQLYGIPLRGTHAHSWVMAFDEEATAFQGYAEAMPNNCVFLVDTYDTIEGVKEAIKAGEALRKTGHQLLGIRLDSGDLAALSKAARQLLDAHGFEQTKIIASNDLDEYKIEQLKNHGAQIDVWGVGTKLATAYDQPALGGVYKMSALKDEQGDWMYKVKLSEQAIKTSNPGIQQVRRKYLKGKMIGDVIYDPDFIENDASLSIPELAPPDQEEDILVAIFKEGQLVYTTPNIQELQQRSMDQLKRFDQKAYPVFLEEGLKTMKLDLIHKFVKQH